MVQGLLGVWQIENQYEILCFNEVNLFSSHCRCPVHYDVIQPSWNRIMVEVF